MKLIIVLIVFLWPIIGYNQNDKIFVQVGGGIHVNKYEMTSSNHSSFEVYFYSSPYFEISSGKSIFINNYFDLLVGLSLSHFNIKAKSGDYYRRPLFFGNIKSTLRLKNIYKNKINLLSGFSYVRKLSKPRDGELFYLIENNNAEVSLGLEVVLTKNTHLLLNMNNSLFDNSNLVFYSHLDNTEFKLNLYFQTFEVSILKNLESNY